MGVQRPEVRRAGSGPAALRFAAVAAYPQTPNHDEKQTKKGISSVFHRGREIGAARLVEVNIFIFFAIITQEKRGWQCYTGIRTEKDREGYRSLACR